MDLHGHPYGSCTWGSLHLGSVPYVVLENDMLWQRLKASPEPLMTYDSILSLLYLSTPIDILPLGYPLAKMSK